MTEFTVSFDGEPPVEASVTILVVPGGASGTTHVRVQVSVVNPAPASSADGAAENVEANRSSTPALASVLSLPARPERGDGYPGARGPRAAGDLTGRELEIMLLVARGNTSRQIGEALFISPRTVEMHVQGSLLKLGCRTRAQAVRKLAELGTLPPEGGTRSRP